MPLSPETNTKTNPLLMFVIYGNMTLYGFIISMRGVSFPLIKNSFGASYSDQGLMTAMVSFTAVCFCIISGIFMGRKGLKNTAVAGFILMICGMASFSFAESYWMAAGLYLILQAGFGFFEIGLNGMGVRIFTKKSAMKMNLLHFCFGLGSICGPFAAGFIVNQTGMRWQMMYPLGLVPVFIFFIITLVTRYPADQRSASDAGSTVEINTALKINSGEQIPKNELSFFSGLKVPLVWIFGLIMGLAGAIESCSVAWSGLFLSDVYGMNIETQGAFFVSVFFMLYTFSRLACGFFIEKAGYLRVTIIGGIAAFALYIAAFILGRNGIVLLPVTGIFISVIYPTMLAVSVGVFRERAQVYSSAMISIAFTLNGLIQFGFGITNNFIGASWAFKSCVPYTAVMVILLLVLNRITKPNTKHN